jgi:putative transposase
MMEAEGKQVSLRKIAKWIGIAWSTMHYKPHRRSTPTVDKNVEHAIYELIQRYPRYGYRRIVVMLRRKMNLVVNRKKVQRIMQRNGWGVKVRFKGFRPRTGSSKSVSESLNHRWATDMTHFFCRDAGWCHAIVVMDCWNREVIGYRISKNQNAQVAVGALEDALIHRFHGRKDSSHGVILRSDNGLIFSSKAFLQLVNAHGLKTEYITPYTPEQNGVVERFMRTMKEECIWLHTFSSFSEAKRIIEDWIREYNTDRPHQELGYNSPVSYKEKLAA